MKQVTILVAPNALGSTVTIPLEMLNAANDIARASRRKDALIRLLIAGEQVGPVTLSGGLTIHCEHCIDDVSDNALVLVPGMWGNPRSAVASNGKLIRWIAREHQAGSLICTITTGAFFPAASGLLDRQAATTHWRFFDLFEQQHPAVKLQRRRFITRANRVYCTGSVNAVRDIMLHLIEQLWDHDIANEVSRQFTHELKRSYESLLLDADQQSTHHDEVIIKVQEWIQENFARPMQITDIAEKFQLSARSLNRRFKLATNTTPVQYLQDIRINHARELLKQSNLVVAEVADAVGYQDTSYFSSLFKKLNDVTPNEYRRLVRNKLFIASGTKQSG